MKRMKIVGLALLAVFAISAVASASASAACTKYCWLVGGKALAEGKEEALTGAASSSYTLTGKAFGFIEVAITCKKAATTGKIIGGEPGKDEATIKYTECSSGTCTPVEPIETKAKSEVVLYTSSSKKYWGDLFFAMTGETSAPMAMAAVVARNRMATHRMATHRLAPRW